MRNAVETWTSDGHDLLQRKDEAHQVSSPTLLRRYPDHMRIHRAPKGETVTGLPVQGPGGQAEQSAYSDGAVSLQSSWRLMYEVGSELQLVSAGQSQGEPPTLIKESQVCPNKLFLSILINSRVRSFPDDCKRRRHTTCSNTRRMHDAIDRGRPQTTLSCDAHRNVCWVALGV